MTNTKTNILFLFNIPSVQSFIFQARKARDLFAGSEILSDLCKAGIEAARGMDEYNPDLIFPIRQEERDSVPNRFLIRFSNIENEENLIQIGKDIEKTVRDKLESIKKKTIYRVQDGIDKLEKFVTEFNAEEDNDYQISEADVTRNKRLWHQKVKGDFERQFDSYFQFQWAFSDDFENDDDGDNYQKAFDEVERRLAALKNLRTFAPHKEWGRKCSLTGQENALIVGFDWNRTGKNQGRFRYPNFTYDKISRNEIAPHVVLVKDFTINAGEGLSAMSFTKRRRKTKVSFESTADIALMDTKNRLLAIQDQEDRDFLDEFAMCFKHDTEPRMKRFEEVDGQLFYEENYNKKYFEQQGLQLNMFKKALTNWRKIRTVGKKYNIPFTKYYAVILFDADNMGAWLSGDKLKKNVNHYDFHKKFSSLLSNFAKEAEKYIDKNNYGQTVYAGGDDFLGFLNLHYLFDALRGLREKFREEVNDKLADMKANPNEELTFSAGITVAHYKIPLSEVLSWVRKTESLAKDKDAAKNKFAVSVLKHSGEIHQSVIRFKNDKGGWNTDNVKSIIDQLYEGNFSNKFIINLEREFMVMGYDVDRDIMKHRDYVKLVKEEINRLIKRAKIKETASVDTLKSNVEDLFSSQGEKATELVDTLSICDFVNRKLKGDD